MEGLIRILKSIVARYPNDNDLGKAIREYIKTL